MLQWKNSSREEGLCPKVPESVIMQRDGAEGRRAFDFRSRGVAGGPEVKQL